MHSINPPDRFYICHFPWPGQLWPQPEQEQGDKKIFKNSLPALLWHWGLSCEQSQKPVCQIPATVTPLTPGRGWAEALGRSGVVVPATDSTWSDKLWARTCCASPELHRHKVTWKPWTGEPSMDAKVPALQQECKSPLKLKEKALMYFKHSKSLGFLFPSLSSLILQPAQKGKQVPWNKPARNSCTKKNNQHVDLAHQILTTIL